MDAGSNQRTLFQTWGTAVSQSKAAKPQNVGEKRRKTTHDSSTVRVAATKHTSLNPLWTEYGESSTNTPDTTVRPDESTAFDCEDDDDDVMVVAVYEAEKNLQCENATNLTLNENCVEAESRSLSPVPLSGRTFPELPGFDGSSAKVWIYPTNYPLREYQLNMSEAALFQNTLVCLPTGLGKTFIASVVMYNFYRWYPSGKIVFMAPTKPLVAQQIEACYKVMGIPQDHMAELTGSTAAKQRQEVWRSKRVFFLTPQVMVNDLSRGTCPAQQVKCVVIDEAHKALGNHAYCQVIRQLTSQTLQFRVLALSATPGGDSKSVQSVISNLLISHIELRSEESPDIQAHSHQRSVEKMVVPLGEALTAHQELYLQVLQKFMSRLVQSRAMAQKDLRTLSKYQLILARDQFRKNPQPNIKGQQHGMLEGDFALCISLYHGYELLMQMGLRSLFFYLQGIVDGSREMTRARNELQRTPIFVQLYHDMEQMFMRPPAGPDEPFMYSHPKLKKLESVVLQHFNRWSGSSTDNNENTRVMIFSSFRESVQEIADMLNRHAPKIKVMTFMGQASAGKGVKGFTQKEQLEVVHRFRQGGFNTLVSTCVGEEGLDIGEVDLIVCFDAQKSPIRLVQRMGRTGRKRHGRIVVILAEGREERTYNQSQSNKRSVYKSIIGNTSGFHMYPNSPRMLPDGVNPTLHKMHITCGQFDHQERKRSSGGGRRSNTEGRTSLVHPKNLILQGRRTSDGFLNSSEYSLWASTMKLEDNEARPILKESHFVSIAGEAPPEEKNRGPTRELSLWEWRHWQHKSLPTHVVDHSVRCQHFVKVMELVDSMKDENEGECSYEEQLRPHTHKNDVVGHVTNRQKSKDRRTGTANKKTKVSPHLEYIHEGEEGEKTQESEFMCAAALTKTTRSSRQETGELEDFTDDPGLRDFSSPHPINDRLVADMDDDACVVLNSDSAVTEPLHSERRAKTAAEEDLELQAMFFLPSWDNVPCPPSLGEPLPGGSEKLKVILANVEELLSRSPQPLTDDLGSDLAPPPSNQVIEVPFNVSFTLDLDDDDDEVDDGSPRVDSPPTPLEENDKLEAKSPSWDDVFEDEEENNDHHRRDEDLEMDSKEGNAHEEADKSRKISVDDFKNEDEDGLDFDRQSSESMDLFGDDEAFLQMTIPNISTPGLTPRSSPGGKGGSEYVSNMSYVESHTTGPRSETAAEDTHTLNTAQTACATHTHPDVTRANANTTHTGAIGEPSSPPTMQRNSESFDNSKDFFSVNFDLGYSLEEEEDEEDEDEEEEEEEGEEEEGADVEAAPAPQAAVPSPASPVSLRVTSNFSTPLNRNTSSSRTSMQHLGSHSSLTRTWTERRGGQMSPFQSPTTKSQALPSPIVTTTPRFKFKSGPNTPVSLSCSKLKPRPGGADDTRGGSGVRSMTWDKTSPRPVRCISDSEDDIVLPRRRNQNVLNPLRSPDVSKMSDVDSPLVVNRKRPAPLNTSGETEAEGVSDDDFQDEIVPRLKPAAQRAERKRGPQSRAKGRCQFLDNEAELSEEDGADVSSDEEDGDDQNQSLEGFVDDNTHFSQALNDSEMRGVYLKSVRSPVVCGRFKMSYRNRHMDVFSQVPEMDETYAEDSFVVSSEVEEVGSSEDETEDVELMPEASYIDGRRQYATRRRVFLHKVRAGAKSSSEQRAEVKAKHTRIIRVNDSSEEEKSDVEDERSSERVKCDGARPEPCRMQPETSSSSLSRTSTVSSRVSLLSKAQRSLTAEEDKKERCRQRLENQYLLSDELDFVEPLSKSSTSQAKTPTSTSSAPQTQRSVCPDVSVSESSAPPAPVCILVDSRCISAGVDLMTSLRQRHAATVQVCSLDGNYFIVSNRMAVARHSQSDLAAVQNRKQLVERGKRLQGLFERVCFLVEKDRSKPGEISRLFQRSRYYDSTLAGLVRTGVRLLWSDGEEDSAHLLVDLARLEQRKGQGICAPLEVKGQHSEQALQMYLNLPSVSYVHALNLSHNFRSISHFFNSPVEAIQKGGCMSSSRAEEIYRFLHYSCDTSLMTAAHSGKTS
ncbi:Fanconi anemia group M protein [Cynoglossus semilaevis]|uniref:Fanconi anemia complementation group M n=1 Tax=Cynoglossus semilaevis TaxID=244447 RepID=A0A3P8UNU5_CYNSE|nr:Fanconi anemia group M protein [Cynoglossus semilaevis]